MHTERSVGPYTPRIAPRSRVHRLRGIDCHVNEWGDPADPLLVALHGWGDCGATFQFVVDAFEERRFVVAPDWRGFGRSAGRAASYWFPDYLADLDALLEIYTPQAPAVLLGHSMGANVAALYAGSMPERVAAVVNVEGFGLRDSDPASAPDNYRRWIEGSRRVPPYTAYRSFDELAGRIRARNPRTPPARALFAARQWAESADDGTVRLRADPAHKLPNAVLYRRAEAAACWSRITAPVLLVCGAESEVPRTAAAGTDPMSGWPSETLPAAGHMLHFDQPAPLAAVIEAFLVNLTSTG